MVVAAHRVAILGGDGRNRPGLVEAPDIVLFRSPRDGGRGEARRLEKALKSGTIGTVVVLVRWNSHSTTRKIRKLCARLGVRVVLVR